jgi:sugar lactone lactonase YvrE
MSDKPNNLRHIASVSNTLGEGIMWHGPTNEIFWLDAGPVCKLFAMEISSGSIRTRTMEANLYCLRNSDDGTLVALSKFGVVWINPANMTVIDSHQILDKNTNYRFNDANCDASGRIWTGTMKDNFQVINGELQKVDSTGQLYRIDKNRNSTIVDHDYCCPNTFAWSPDDKTMYCADSISGWIYAYHFNAEKGKISRRRQLYKNMNFGTPDGSAIDSEGCLWNARWGGSAVLRITPAGFVDRVIKLPVSRVTDCTFGGDDLRTLFITTAKQGISPSELDLEPLAGDVFAISVGVAGVDKGVASFTEKLSL